MNENWIKKYNKQIINELKRYEQEVIFVLKNENIKCTCRHMGRADYKCPKCLGLGYNIRIAKINAAMRNNKGYVQYCLLNKLEKDDILIYNKKAYLINEFVLKRSFHGEPLYWEILLVPKKMEVEVFKTNFKKLTGIELNLHNNEERFLKQIEPYNKNNIFEI